MSYRIFTKRRLYEKAFHMSGGGHALERRTPEQEQIRRASETRRAAERVANAMLTAERQHETVDNALVRMQLDAVDTARRNDKRKRDEEQQSKEPTRALCEEQTLVPDQLVHKRCCVCLDAPNTHAYVPCGHKCVCGQCSLGLHTTGPQLCPVCRTTYKSCVRVIG